MKSLNFFKVWIFTLLLSVSGVFSFAQTNSIYNSFQATKSNSIVYLNWQINAGSTCNGIQIYRSIDGVNFLMIEDLLGICGSVSSAINYSFTDAHPVKNSFNSYRLGFGNFDISEIVSVEIIDTEKGGYQVRPNPIINEAKIYFENKFKRGHVITLYDLNGVEVFTSTSENDFFQLDCATLQNGVYLFNISTSDNFPKASGKLIVQH